MKPTTLLISILALAASSLSPAGCGRATGEAEYIARFTLPLPADWERRENFRDMPLVGVAPVADGEFPVNVNVRLIGNAERLDLDELYVAHFDPEVAASVHRDFTLIAVDERTVGQFDAKRIVYTHRIDPDDLKSLAYLVRAGQTAYVITFNAAADQYAGYESEFDKIVARFEAE